MQAFDVVAVPARRRILELLSEGERTAGDLTNVVRDELGISQPAVSQHLKVLRDNGFATVRVAHNRRLYAVDTEGLEVIDTWIAPFRRLWADRGDGDGTASA